MNRNDFGRPILSNELNDVLDVPANVLRKRPAVAY
jgi:hypothetical protein